jgi:DNA-binding IscR family transcriptional regulator
MKLLVPQRTMCVIHPAWIALSDAVRERLAGTTLADLAAEDRRLMRTEPARSARSGR